MHLISKMLIFKPTAIALFSLLFEKIKAKANLLLAAGQGELDTKQMG